MMEADALLLLQGAEFNNQIPGKAYEYLRSRKPILALTQGEGATAQLVSDVAHAKVADINNVSEIQSAVESLRELAVDDAFDVSRYGRKNRSSQLVSILNSMV